MESLKDAKAFFERDLFAINQTGIEIIEASECYGKCKFIVTPNHLNADGFVMGGALYTLADLAFAVAVNTTKTRVVTLSSDFHFLSPTNDKEVYATATKIKDGKTICLYSVSVEDGKGKLIAQGTFSGFVKGNKL